MDIKEIALKVGPQAFEEHPYDKGHVVSPSGYTWIDDKLIEFAEALIAEIAKQNEPVACRYKDHNGYWCFMDKQYGNSEPLYIFPLTAEQIANETAEAIAKFVAFQRNDIPATGIEFAEVIRSGAWKEFKK